MQLDFPFPGVNYVINVLFQHCTEPESPNTGFDNDCDRQSIVCGGGGVKGSR